MGGKGSGKYTRTTKQLIVDYLHNKIDNYPGSYADRINLIDEIEGILRIKKISVLTLSYYDATYDLERSPLLKILQKKINKNIKAGKIGIQQTLDRFTTECNVLPKSVRDKINGKSKSNK